jgi:hypothetical protein
MRCSWLCTALWTACFWWCAQAAAQSIEPAACDGFAVVAQEEAEPGVCQRWEVRGEYLMWFLREGRIPPLLTTSSAASQGQLGRPDTVVLYGDDRLETRHGDRFFGGRGTLIYWFNDSQTLGIEGGGTFLERDSTYFKATSDGSTLLARPFFSALDGTSMSEIIGGPFTTTSPPAPPLGGVRTGGFVGYSRIELFVQEANLRYLFASTPRLRLELLAGTRFLEMRDRLDLTATGYLLPDRATLFGMTDHFHVHDFYAGGQIGARATYNWGRCFAEGRATVALGANDEQVQASGDRLYQTPFERLTLPYGLAVLPSNSGTFHHTAVNSVYEINANVGCALTAHWRVLLGYTFLCWNKPIRAGDQVDLVVNPSQITGPLIGPARPTIPFKEDLFWAQGLSAALDLRW